MEDLTPLKIHGLVGRVLETLGVDATPTVLRKIGEQLIMLGGGPPPGQVASGSNQPPKGGRGRRSRSQSRDRQKKAAPAPNKQLPSTPNQPKIGGLVKGEIGIPSLKKEFPADEGLTAGLRRTWKTKLAEQRKRALYSASLVGSIQKDTTNEDRWNRRAFLWNSLETLGDTWSRYQQQFADWSLAKNPLRDLPVQEDKKVLLDQRPGGQDNALSTQNGHFVIKSSKEWTLLNSN